MFIVNQTYTKKQIYVLLDVPYDKQGGYWDTGYRQYGDDFYLFVNVGIPGRTGHNYSNYWDGDLLHWEGKSKSHIGQPSIKKMFSLSKDGKVRVFTRIHDTDPFTYEGRASVHEHFETQPIKVIWTFDNIANISNISSIIPGQVLPGTLWEGGLSKIMVNKHERNPWARRECINHYGSSCQVCEFDFGRRYGEIGKNFIHVHHHISLSLNIEKYEVDPIKDLIPVCPNCHCMLHKKAPAYTVEELKRLMST